MPFIKYEKLSSNYCVDPEHNPPHTIGLQSGRHTYECPKCGQATTLTVLQNTCEVEKFRSKE